MASTQRYRPTRSDSYVSTRVFQMGKHQRRFKLYVINLESCVCYSQHISPYSRSSLGLTMRL